MTNQNNHSREGFPNIFLVVFLFLIALWVMAQPLAGYQGLSIQVRYQLFYWKNLLGIIIVGYGFVVMFASPNNKQVISEIDWGLFAIALLFPTYSLFNMLFRGSGTSWQEQVLYFAWVTALIVVFPSILSSERKRHMAISVILLTTLTTMLVLIFEGFESENLLEWTDYKYRVSFNFANPNIFAASWQMILFCSLYMMVMTKSRSLRMVYTILVISALFFIIQARSESVLLGSIGLLATLVILNRKWDANLRFAILHLALALFVVLIFFFLRPDLETIDQATSGRIRLWQRSLTINFGGASPISYLMGRANLLVASLKNTGIRTGFQASRAQVDNVYLAMTIQNGLLGLLLFILPILLILIRMGKAFQITTGRDRVLYSLVIGVWIGIALQMLGMSIIPSFGNVANIFLFIVTSFSVLDSRRRTASLPSRDLVPKAASD